MIATGTRKAGLLAVGAAAFVSLEAVPEARAYTNTGIQNSGIECVQENTNPAWRDVNGFQNTQTFQSNAFCTLIPPSHDSYTSSFNTYSVKDVELFYAGTQPNWCYVVVQTRAGGIYYSNAMTSGTSSTSGTPVMKLTGGFKVVQDNYDPASQGVECNLPSGTRILGSTAWHDVTDITGGI